MILPHYYLATFHTSGHVHRQNENIWLHAIMLKWLTCRWNHGEEWKHGYRYLTLEGMSSNKFYSEQTTHFRH